MGGGGGGLFDFRVTPNPNLVWMDFHLDVEFDKNLCILQGVPKKSGVMFLNKDNFS